MTNSVCHGLLASCYGGRATRCACAGKPPHAQHTFSVRTLSEEGAMKRQWHVHRQVLPCVDGQRRWDRAYQLLEGWAAAGEAATCAAPGEVGSGADSDEEAEHARRRLCARLDPAPSPAADG